MGNTPSAEGQAHSQTHGTVNCLALPSSPSSSPPPQRQAAPTSFASVSPSTPTSAVPAHRRSPQKLSKPHVVGSRRLAEASTPTLLNPNGLVSRLSGSHNRQSPLSKSMPPPPPRPPPRPPVSSVSAALAVGPPASQGLFPDYEEPEPELEPELEPEPEVEQEDDDKQLTQTAKDPSRRRSLLRSLSMRSTWSRKSEKSSSNGSSNVSSAVPSSQQIRGRTRARSMTHESLQATASIHQSTDRALGISILRRDSVSHNQTSWGAPRRHSRANSIQRDQDFTSCPPVPPVSDSTASMTSAASHLSPGLPISRVNSDLSAYAPMRRRSVVQTPGVATRTPWNGLPPLTNYRHGSYATTPAMSRRNSSVSSPGGELSWPLPPQQLPMPIPRSVDNVERVETPCEDEYKQLGGIRFGSLRIMNGSPMLSPAVEQEAWVESKSPKIGCEQALSGEGSDDDDGDEDVLVIKAIRPKLVTVVPTASASIAGGGRTETKTDADSTRSKIVYYPSTVGGAASLASPVPSPTSPYLVTTSKHTAVEDDLFENDSISDSPEYSPLEVLSVREDPSAKVPRPERPSVDPSQATSRTGSDVIPSPTSPVGHRPEKPLAKADSGYCSNVSLRSLKPRHPAGGGTSEESSPNEDSMASFLGELQAMSQSGPTPDELRVRIPDTDSPAAATTPRDSTPVSPKPMETLPPPAVGENVFPSLFSVHGNPSEVGDPQQELLHSSPEVDVSAVSIASIPRRPGRLRRLLSGGSSKSSTATSDVFQVDENIPPVPKLFVDKSRQRAGRFAVLSARPKLRSAPSTRTLGTIFSVGSVEITAGDEGGPPSVLNKSTVSSRQYRRLSFHAFAQGIMPGRRAVSRKAAPRKSLPGRREPIVPAVSARATLKSTHWPNKSTATDDVVISTDKVDVETRVMMTFADVGANAAHSSPSPLGQVLSSSGARTNAHAPEPRAMSMRDLGRDLHRIRAELLAPELNANSVPTDGTRVFSTVRPAIEQQDDDSVPSRLRLRRSMGQLRRSLMLRPQASHGQLGGVVALARKSSREVIAAHSYSQDSKQPASTLSAKPRRAMSLASEQLADLDISGEACKPVLAEMGGSTVPSHYYGLSSGSSSSQSHSYESQPRQGLRYRSSYDGHLGSMGAQDGRRKSQTPSHGSGGGVSQGHHRGRSDGHGHGHGRGTPYRVLHSYNSPAYRNVPIWG